MVTRRALVLVNGIPAELPQGDDLAGAGGGSALPQGSGEIDFGAFPGSPHATLIITGQGGILATSICEAWIIAKATADHSEDEHMLDAPRLICSAIIPGTGFTINGLLREPPIKSMSLDRGNERTQNPPLIYGRWSVAWRWK